MGATIRFLIISAAIIIPWGIVRVADLEIRLIAFLKPILSSNMVILGLLLLPPMAWVLIKWLFGPRGKPARRYSGNKDILIRFRG